MSHIHLTTEERACIALYRENGISISDISRVLGRDKSTISRELKRNGGDPYDPVAAQQRYKKRRRRCKRKYLLAPNTEAYGVVCEDLDMYWSPEQICNADVRCTVSMSTIYRAVKAKRIPTPCRQKLRHYPKVGWKKGRKHTELQDIRHIADRPAEVETRQEFGHWELDTVIFHRKSSVCLATMVERKSRLLIAKLIHSQTMNAMTTTIVSELSKLPEWMVKTLTVDRGKEFYGWKEVEAALGVKVYFADAYKPYQRGTNENTNGLIRQFYPKRHFRGEAQEADVVYMVTLLNNRPRKCLNWSSPSQILAAYCCI